ncbi:MAG: hypothetical protein PH343_09595 [Nitrospira sp.]|nr:hypothetical protein [Nitrospira sp.]
MLCLTEILNYAIGELVKRLCRKNIFELEGKVKWEGNLNKSWAIRL